MSEPTPLGRPRMYASAAAMADKVENYFIDCEAKGKPPTIAGLAYSLGFSDRHALSEYEEYGADFSATIKKARLRIEQDRSERLLGKDTFTPGVIFDLKNNHGWKDQTQQELSGKLEFQGIERAIVKANDPH